MPWLTPRTGTEELAAGVGPGSVGRFGASLVEGKPDGLAIDLEGRAGMLVAKGAVRAPGALPRGALAHGGPGGYLLQVAMDFARCSSGSALRL